MTTRNEEEERRLALRLLAALEGAGKDIKQGVKLLEELVSRRDITQKEDDADESD